MTQILEADSMWLEYNGRKILQSVFIKTETGKITGLLGLNGTGKSSLLRMIFGTQRGQGQSVRVNGRYVSHPYLEKDLIRYLPQHHFVPPYLPLSKVCSLYQVSLYEMTAHFPELKSYGNESVGRLSGGNRRLVETLIILLSPAPFVLLDEPFTHLSPIAATLLANVIEEQRKYKGIILSDHLFNQVVNLSDDVYLLNPGGRTIHLTNPSEELRLLGYTR